MLAKSYKTLSRSCSLVISLVYESFSYVYQGLVLKTGTITSDDLRQFKDSWALVDPKGTGCIPPELLARFTSLLPERLSMRVYRENFSVANLRKECHYRLPLSPGEIDLEKLNARLRTLPTQEVRERRWAMLRLRKELLSTRDIQLGISMQTALTTLVYYHLVDSRENLR
jgi:hypothetical protein